MMREGLRRDDAPIRRCLKGWGDVLAALPRSMLGEVRDSYCVAGPHKRHYHDGEHIGGIWSTWLKLGGDPNNLPMLLATAYHDIVYETGKPKGWNERESAKRLYDASYALKDNRVDVAVAMSMIVATEDHLNATLPEAIIFCDLDLAGLACPMEEFRDNTRRIRAEHGHVGLPMFNAGRKAFWESILEHPKIFRSGITPLWWDFQARENIEQDIRDIEAAT